MDLVADLPLPQSSSSIQDSLIVMPIHGHCLLFLHLYSSPKTELATSSTHPPRGDLQGSWGGTLSASAVVGKEEMVLNLKIRRLD